MMRAALRKFITSCGLVCVGFLLLAGATLGAAEPPWSPVEVSVFGTGKGFDFANDYGVPFYTNDRDAAGKVGCDDVCLEHSWLPVFARAAATPMGDWTVVLRPDKAAQWAYKGKPVYNFFASNDPKEAQELISKDTHWKRVVP